MVFFIFVAVVVLASSASAQLRFSARENETIRRTLEFSPGTGTKILELDNVNGSIRVTGYDGRTVEMVAEKTIEVQSAEKIRTAKQEVKLDITDKADTIRIYVDEPGRDCNCRDRWSNWRSGNYRWADPGYRVTFDFTVRVPRETNIRLRTLNGSEIRVQNVAGDFDVENINGQVEMLGIAGSGKASALNRDVNVTFVSNPKSSSYFRSMNGDLKVTFPENLSADVRFKTFNGGVYTDFPVTALPAVATAERRDGKFIYRSDVSGVRIGKGGPEIMFDGFNGDIRILRAK